MITFIYIYLFLGILTCYFIHKKITENQESVSFFWNNSLAEEIRDEFIKHPWLFTLTNVLIVLLWPIILIEVLRGLDDL